MKQRRSSYRLSQACGSAGMFRLIVLLVIGLMAWAGAAHSVPIVDETESGAASAVAVIRARQQGARTALAAVEQIFSVPESTQGVSLALDDLPDRMHGVYGIVPPTGERKLRVSYRSKISTGTPPGAAIVTVHELGHWFDNCVLGPAFVANWTPEDLASNSLPLSTRLSTPAKTSIPFVRIDGLPVTAKLPKPLNARAGPLQAWWSAVQESRTYHDLNALRDSPRGRSEPGLGAFIGYVTSPPEMFARSFAQYVALKSQNEVLLHQAREISSRDYPLNGQWNETEFRPIYQALDELFQGRGWLRPQNAQVPDG